MSSPPAPWPDTTASRGTKFFAQAFRSFLDEASFEGFRAYSLDTLGRLREADTLISDINRKRVSEASLKVVLEELTWSIRSDDAALSIAPTECQIVLDRCREPRARLASAQAIRLLIRKLSVSYSDRLITLVADCINDDRRGDLLARVGYLASHLMNSGVNRQYVIDKIDERFFDRPVLKVGRRVVETFLKNISQKKTYWTVIMRVDQFSVSMLTAFPNWKVITLHSLSAHAQTMIHSLPEITGSDSFCATRSLSSDPYQAVVDAHKKIEEISSLRVLAQNPIDPRWSMGGYVYAARSERGTNVLLWEAPLLGASEQVAVSGHRLKQATNLSKRLYSNFDENSRERVTRALSTAGLAARTHQESVQLISLWSSFEVFAGDPPEDEARISHFLKTLSPCVSVRYHRRLFVEIYNTLILVHRRKFTELLLQVPTTIKSNPHTTFAKMIVLEDNDSILRKLFELTSENPILTHRIWRLYRSYRAPSDCLRAITGHNERVEWQLQRTYRVRNSLVHSGKSPLYTDTLIRNALEYLRSAVMTVVRMASKSGQEMEIDQVIAEVGFEWQALLRHLDDLKKGKFDELTAHRVFSAL